MPRSTWEYFKEEIWDWKDMVRTIVFVGHILVIGIPIIGFIHDGFGLVLGIVSVIAFYEYVTVPWMDRHDYLLTKQELNKREKSKGA